MPFQVFPRSVERTESNSSELARKRVALICRSGGKVPACLFRPTASPTGFCPEFSGAAPESDSSLVHASPESAYSSSAAKSFEALSLWALFHFLWPSAFFWEELACPVLQRRRASRIPVSLGGSPCASTPNSKTPSRRATPPCQRCFAKISREKTQQPSQLGAPANSGSDAACVTLTEYRLNTVEGLEW